MVLVDYVAPTCHLREVIVVTPQHMALKAGRDYESMTRPLLQTDTLHQGQELKDWDELVSSNRVFCLTLFSFGLIIMIVPLGVLLSCYWVYKNIDFKGIAKNIKKLLLLHMRRVADKLIIIELVDAAMEELIRMAQAGEPLWVPSSDNSSEILTEDEYTRMFPHGMGPKKLGLKSEASRESAVVIMNHITLVELLMDVMSAEFQVPSPLVPTRENYFVRYCKQHADGTWAVVDVSLDNLRPSSISRCKRWPSGCLIQELPNGYSKVTWVEHVEVDDRAVHNIYRLLVNSGLAFGAKRWVATLEKHCERLASVMANNIPSGDVGVLQLPSGYLFNQNGSLIFFEENSRNEWDILSYGGLVQEMAHITNGRDPGNCVSLLRVNSANSSESNMLILQESSSDSTGSYVIYAPVDIAAMNVVLHGGDPDYVALLPSGFAILPDRPGQHEIGIPEVGTGGSLLTVAFQILVDSVPTAKLSLGSVATVNNLIECTVERIKAAVTSP
ncbi:hypothetical protein E3N88_14092 [Mikania micrantha]|uniref:START domain-containing protein n=1 Tax=Mikania micrantha TaxID=192012 RepID=A0A5N6P0U3_9ASTR|nr:hypothetical protein E3N88_14092 [Mikania micrantha]